MILNKYYLNSWSCNITLALWGGWYQIWSSVSCRSGPKVVLYHCRYDCNLSQDSKSPDPGWPVSSCSQKKCCLWTWLCSNVHKCTNAFFTECIYVVL